MTTSNPLQPDFSLTDLDGQRIEYSALRGRPILLNFFTSACPWCQVEMPKLAEVYERHRKVEVAVVGVAVGDDTAASARAFAQEKKLHFPIALDAALPRAFGLERVPAVVLINGDGAVARVYQGSSEQLSGIVEQTLLAAAEGSELPEFHFIGNGCAATAG
jgi:peroxiredoxin